VLAALTAVLVALFAAAACGGSEDGSGDFTKEFASINTSLKTLGDEIGTTLTNAPSQTNAQLASAFSGYATQLQTLRTKLDDTSPPGDLKQDVFALSEAMAQAAKDMIAIAGAATAGDPAKAKAATMTFVSDSRELRDARLKLVKATGVEDAKTTTAP
jgi:hypothetical protein